ncbi:MAG TPA: hypothetical protein VD907_02025 [Verrucomicrobiae bacterium]|nr:hypothetical protein [Verrucomicrobiae bacterium]
MAAPSTTEKNKKPGLASRLTGRWQQYLQRTPHRSFRLTRRRDYARDFQLPGYWKFTGEVWQVLIKDKKLFLGVVVVYALLSILAVGMISQQAYDELNFYLNDVGQEITGGDVGGFTKALVVFGVTLMGDLNSGALSEAQQIYSALLSLLCWLTMVWLLRQRLAGHAVKLRDGLYSSGAPIVPSLLITLVIIVQLLPVALGFIGLQVAQSSGIGESGVEAMMLWLAVILLGVLSLYWVTSSLVAMVLVTIPGMYPFAALKEAGQLVLGRRLRLMLRLLWLLAMIVCFWALLLIPIILIDRLLGISWLPLVPVSVVVVGAFTIVWSATYIYLLYRRLIDAE